MHLDHSKRPRESVTTLIETGQTQLTDSIVSLCFNRVKGECSQRNHTLNTDEEKHPVTLTVGSCLVLQLLTD